MKKAKFSDAQIMTILRQAEKGFPFRNCAVSMA